MPVGPFSRYRDLPVVVVAHQTRGVTRSLPIRRRPTEVTGQGRVHRLSAFDEVDLLARRFYGREDLYWLILDANQGRLPDAFMPGETLTIPPQDAATQVERPL
jgi:nucleoid-associated protein YgaU